MLLHPDGSQEVLVEGGHGAVTDPFLSFDAQSVYYSYFPDVRDQGYNSQRDLPWAGANIYRLHLGTREVQQLTHGEFTPNTGAGHFDESNPVDPGPDFDSLGYGILNLGPCPVAGGKIAFTSNRNGFLPPKGYTNPTLQLFVMDEDGQNVTAIAPMNISSALHPTPLADGRLIFSSHEGQGLRDVRQWGIWAIWPDGRQWQPVVSAFHEGGAFHFATQLSGGDLVVVELLQSQQQRLRRALPAAVAGAVRGARLLAGVRRPEPAHRADRGRRVPLSVPDAVHAARLLRADAVHASRGRGRAGRRGRRPRRQVHRALGGARRRPAGRLDPGARERPRPPDDAPYYDAGLYLIPGGNVVHAPSELVKIKNDPAYNEAWPRAVVPYAAVHGVAEPAALPWLPNDGTVHAALPAGTPYGLVGTSSVY